MAVRCAKCNEELMGAVNRCWRCGTEFALLPTSLALPPIRRPPVDLAAWNRALQGSVEQPAASNGNLTESGAATEMPAAEESATAVEVAPATDLREPVPNEVAAFFGSQPIRVGSPFAEEPAMQRLSNASARTGPASVPTPVTSAPRTAHSLPAARASAAVPIYPKNAAADGGAFGALLLGVLSAIFALFLFRADVNPLGPLVTALIGLGMGVWGVYSPRRRGLAVFALLLCCFALAVSSFYAAVDLYERIYEEDPFDPTDDDSSAALPEGPVESRRPGGWRWEPGIDLDTLDTAATGMSSGVRLSCRSSGPHSAAGQGSERRA